jgi:hypothetical protein
MCVCERERISNSFSSPLVNEREREKEKKEEEEEEKKREREDRFRSSPSIPLTCSHECTHIPRSTVHMRYIHRIQSPQ